MKRLVFLMLAAWALTGCAKFTIAPPKASAPPAPPKLIWAGTSAGFSYRWTAADIVASPVAAPARQALSALGLTIADFHEISRTQVSDCDFQRVAQLQSVVGTIVSIRDDDTMKCAGGASKKSRKTVAIDVRHPALPVLLGDYFPAHQLDSLRTRANRACRSKPENLFNRFTFGDLHANSVSVVVTLPSDCSTDAITTALNVPAKLRSALALAAQRKQGFLLRDQPAISGGQTTTINYHYRVEGP